MVKDPRYGAVKVLIEEGYINYFKDIFLHLPKSVLGFDMGINNTRITRLIIHPDQFTIKELNRIAVLIDIKPMKIIHLVYGQLQMEQSKLTKNN
jgi:hypothetical protein